jgi:4-alpha-glucanotransferase
VSAPTSDPAASASSGDGDADLVRLAAGYGVATDYWDWQGRRVVVARDTLVAVLGALGVDATTPQAVAHALHEHEQAGWRRAVPAVVVLTEGVTHEVPVHLPHGAALDGWVDLEDGVARPLRQVDRWMDPRWVDGVLVGEATLQVPADLPTGWHRLRVRVGPPPGAAGDAGSSEHDTALVITPRRLSVPAGLHGRATWGVMAQLYAVRSTRSWGLGDLADLAELATWAAQCLGAGFALVNPLHAAEPAGPMEPSPYLPVTRRFPNPVYLRVEDVPEVGYLRGQARARVEELAEAAAAADRQDTLLDRQAVWAAKREALGHLWAVPRSRARQRRYEDFLRREGRGLVDFATWCALVEEYGVDRAGWPAGLDDPAGPEVAAERARLGERVDFYCWTQWLLDDQLAAAAAAARDAGMPLGVMHDLAVGVHPHGADAWALPDVLARGVSVGAPPDAFNQQGQDWAQPPWRPDALAEAGYAPYRDMLRTVLRHSGGLRVDHVMGLFRLWWVPAGRPPSEGTYVRYDHEALVGILALEAARAEALVVGEDLGTVEPWVRDYLHDRGILGTSILWFERDAQGRPLPPARWREDCLATVTTHDLPPTAGYLTGEHVRLRDRLGLLTRPVEEEWAVDEADRRAWLDELVAEGLLDPAAHRLLDPAVDNAALSVVVAALHRFLARTPARLLGVSLSDLVGDCRVINQPGTSDEYPNWRLPLADSAGRPVLLDHIDDVVCAAVRDAVRGGRS